MGRMKTLGMIMSKSVRLWCGKLFQVFQVLESGLDSATIREDSNWSRNDSTDLMATVVSGLFIIKDS